MKKALLLGYYGFNNLGDEAVLQAVCQQLSFVMPDLEITALSNTPQQTAAAYGIKAADRWKLTELWRQLGGSDIFILGGGSLLQDVTGSKSLLFYLGQIFFARLAGKPVFAYAQGIGPINGARNRRLTAKILNKAVLTVRDAASADFLRSIGLRQPIAVTCDPVLALQPQACDFALSEEPCIGVSLRAWPGLDTASLAAALDALMPAAGRLLFLPFHEPEDRQICLQVMGLLRRPALIAPPDLSAAQMIGLLGRLDAVIGMRLHSLIMAAAAATPFGAISYDPKVDSFCAQAGAPLLATLDRWQAEDFVAAAKNFLSQKAGYRNTLEAKQASWRQLCRDNAMMVKDLLEKDR